MIAVLAFVKTLWGFAKLIPWWVYVLIVAVLYHVAAVQMAEHRATKECNAKWEKQIKAERDAYESQLGILKAKQQEVITRTVIEYRDRIQIVKEKGNEIVKEVPVLVPMDSPLLAGGVRVLHDAAAVGNLPDDPEGAARAAAPTPTTALMETVATNYETCRTEFVKLEQLQKLVAQLGETK